MMTAAFISLMVAGVGSLIFLCGVLVGRFLRNKEDFVEVRSGDRKLVGFSSLPSDVPIYASKTYDFDDEYEDDYYDDDDDYLYEDEDDYYDDYDYDDLDLDMYYHDDCGYDNLDMYQDPADWWKSGKSNPLD